MNYVIFLSMKEELEDEKAFLAEDVNYLKQHSMELNGKIKDAEKIRVRCCV